ncbi:hypothetical protein ACTHPH_07965 [Paenibacillus pasadenensis]
MKLMQKRNGRPMPSRCSVLAQKESLLLERAAEKHTRPFLMDLEETVQFMLSTAIMS